ncbi:hypothetical protein D3C83_335090 [compost metagenome]
MTAIVLCNDDGTGPLGRLLPVAQKIETALCGEPSRLVHHTARPERDDGAARE